MQTYYIICIRCTAGNFFCSNNECHAFFTQAARENTGLYFEKRAHTMYSDLQMATGDFRDSSSAQNRIKKALQTPHFEVFTTLSQLWQRARDSNPRGFRLTRVPGGLLSHSVNPLCYFVQIRTTFTIITQSMNFASEIYRKFYFIYRTDLLCISSVPSRCISSERRKHFSNPLFHKKSFRTDRCSSVLSHLNALKHFFLFKQLSCAIMIPYISRRQSSGYVNFRRQKSESRLFYENFSSGVWD